MCQGLAGTGADPLVPAGVLCSVSGTSRVAVWLCGLAMPQAQPICLGVVPPPRGSGCEQGGLGRALSAPHPWWFTFLTWEEHS